MSKKRKEAIEKSAFKPSENLEANDVVVSSDFRSKQLKNSWRRLSFQGKLLAILVIGLTAVGTFGAGLKYFDEQAKQIISQRETATLLNPSQENLLSKINPLLPAATPMPTTQLSKEYIYAGSRLLTVEDANANAAPPADLAVWRPSTGVWWVMVGQGSQQVSSQWGMAGDIPVPGDYDGDGKTDFSIFRPDSSAQTGTWYVLYSSTNSWTAIQWGMHSDEVSPADFDGDGKTDIALWRPSNGAWYILKSSDNQSLSFQYGSTGDKPAPADYDGDGRTDAAVWRASNGYWYIYRSSDGGVTYAQLGTNGDIPSSGDFDGDGKADIGIWRDSNKTFYSTNSSNQVIQSAGFSSNSPEPISADFDGDGRADYVIRSGANWIIRNSSTSSIQSIPWQSSGDKAVQNDYDGDGKVDIAVWNGATGYWFIRQSRRIGQSNELRQVQWGQSGDTLVPA